MGYRFRLVDYCRSGSVHPAKFETLSHIRFKMANSRVISQMSDLDHLRNKTMYSGSRRQGTVEMFVVEGSEMRLQKIKLVPCLFKCVGELVENAIDNAVNFPRKVKNIGMTFDIETGRISVSNDGPGFTVTKVKTTSGEEMWSPQMAYACMRSGDNLVDDPESKTGGVNGIGATLTAAFSQEFSIDTVDRGNVWYRQTLRNQIRQVDPPVIEKSSAAPKDRRNGGTVIEFLPYYEKLGFKGGYYKERDGATLMTLWRTRATYAAAFMESATVRFNGDAIDLGPKKSRFTGFCRMFTPNVWAGKFASKTDSMQVCVGVSDGKQRAVSIINGVMVFLGGSHIKTISNSIVAGLKARVVRLIGGKKAKFNKNLITNSLFLFVRASLSSPEFSSQVKDTLSTPAEAFADYKFKKSDYDQMWQILEEPIMSAFLGKNTGKPKRIRRTIGAVKKHRPAKYAGHKTNAVKCSLMVVEGDSAMGLIHEGIVHKKSPLSYDYFGTYSIQGVCMNAYKETRVLVDKKTSKTVLVRTKRLTETERLASLVEILGLDYAKTYETAQERKTLRYGRCVICTDADVDGRGQIAGLLVAFFFRFWPALIEHEWLCRFDTPVVRAYPKNAKKLVKEFFREEDFELWKRQHGTAGYTVKYLKGLGGHKKSVIGPMFKKFESMVVVYYVDDDAATNMEAFYGGKPALRKQRLATPVDVRPEGNQRVSVSEQLTLDTKLFQKDNVKRKLVNFLDGKVPSSRKLLFTGRTVFKAANLEMKTSVFTSTAAALTAYKHGAASLESTASRQAQNDPRLRNLPSFIACGNFGTRMEGGQNFAHPRYTALKLNKLVDLIFPRVDDCLLDWTWDDKKRTEPIAYVPIIPTAVLENESIPATAWKLRIWARDIMQVFANVRDLISGRIAKARPMDFWKNSHNGEVREVTVRGTKKLYSVGDYKFSKKTGRLVITEVPVSFHSGMYSGAEGKYSLVGRDEVIGIPTDSTNDDQVHIEIMLRPGAYDEIEKKYGDENFDALEHWMGLYVRMDDHINMIAPDDSVITFASYAAVVDAWFPARKKMYADRIARQTALCRMRILFYESVIRYTKESDDYGLTPKITQEKATGMLAARKYPMFDQTMLFSPKFIPIEDLGQICDGPTASMKYLLGLSRLSALKEACAARAKKLREEKATLKRLLADPDGQKTWLAELDQLEELIAFGLKTGWLYDEKPARWE